MKDSLKQIIGGNYSIIKNDLIVFSETSKIKDSIQSQLKLTSKYGSLSLFIYYLKENNYIFYEECIEEIIKNNHLHMLEYIDKYLNFSNKEYEISKYINKAIDKGHIKMVRYVKSITFVSLSTILIRSIKEKQNLIAIDLVNEEVKNGKFGLHEIISYMNIAFVFKNMDFVDYLSSLDKVENIVKHAIYDNSEKVVEYFVELNLFDANDVLVESSCNNNMKFVKYAISKGARNYRAAIIEAYERDFFDIVRYLQDLEN